MPTKAEIETHRIINQERKKRGLSWVDWSPHMYSLAKSHANKMAKEGRMYHSNRYALKGGECCLCSRGKPSARTIVSTWMASKAGHAEWLMDSRVRKAAVGIGQSRHGTYVAWSFSGGSAVVHYLSKRLRGLLR